MNKSDKARAGAATAAAIASIVFGVERRDDGKVQRVNMLGVIPIWDRDWRVIERVRANIRARRDRRVGRRAARRRDRR